MSKETRYRKGIIMDLKKIRLEGLGWIKLVCEFVTVVKMSMLVFWVELLVSL
jgi:hypothetical protein